MKENSLTIIEAMQQTHTIPTITIVAPMAIECIEVEADTPPAVLNCMSCNPTVPITTCINHRRPKACLAN